MSHLEPPIAIAPLLLILIAPFIIQLHWPLAAVLCVVHCVMVVCCLMCCCGGCCHHWVMPWQFYHHVVPVYVVNCKNIVNKAKRKTYLRLELGGD